MRDFAHQTPCLAFFLVVFLCLLFYLPSPECSEPNTHKPKTLQKVRLILQWLPQAQFAGYYVAHERGLYKKYGIDLEILPSGPDAPPSVFLREKKAEFATMWLSTAIQKRANGLRLINIGQMIQRSALMLVVKKDSGIKRPADLHNKKVSIFDGDFSIQPMALFKRLSINPRLITQSTTVNLFLRGGVDAVSAMWYNEYHMILSAGINPEELQTFLYSDYGLNFPEDGIYVLESFFKDHADIACAFVKASIEGWEYALLRPEEAVDTVLKRMIEAGVPANRAHQKWMLLRIGDLMRHKGKDGLGVLFKNDYDLVAKELQCLGLINKIPAFEDFHISCR